MWLVEIVDQLLGGDLDRYGIEPHDVTACSASSRRRSCTPASGHLIGNTIPFLMLGAAIALERPGAGGRGSR